MKLDSISLRSNGGSPVQAVSRALALLEFVCRAGRPLTLGEAAEQAGLVRPTAHRLLRTLIDYGLVSQDAETKTYRPGLKLFELSNDVVRGLDLRSEALPEIRQLSLETNETVHLGILDEGDVVYIDKVESSQTIRMYSAVGKRSPAHCTGLGKILLAHLPAEELRRVIQKSGLREFTRTTITTVEALERELELVRERGYAIDDGEHEPEIRCVACPVRGHDGLVIAAVSLTAPATRMSRERTTTLAPLVRHYAERASARLGYVAGAGTVSPTL
jgi:DNA-binding IclR family transcriptional regulator